jgi:hypothetical protein
MMRTSHLEDLMTKTVFPGLGQGPINHFQLLQQDNIQQIQNQNQGVNLLDLNINPNSENEEVDFEGQTQGEGFDQEMEFFAEENPIA